MTTMTTTTTPKYDRLPEWFASFCDPDTIRYAFDRPWLHTDGYIYATDGRACVRVRAELIEEAGRPGPPENGKRVPRDMGAAYGMAAGDRWDADPVAIPEGVGPCRKACGRCGGKPEEKREEKCPECRGSGVCQRCDCGPCGECDGEGVLMASGCPDCDSEGSIVDWTAVEIPGRSDGLALSVANIRRVLDAGGRIYARTKDAHKSALKFTIGDDGDFEGRLMPVHRG